MESQEGGWNSELPFWEIFIVEISHNLLGHEAVVIVISASTFLRSTHPA